MKNMKLAGIIILIAVFMIAGSPASAVLLEETYMGWVSTLDPSKETLRVYVTDVYQGDGTWLTYGKSKLPTQIVPGTTPNPSVFNDLKQGDPVEVTIMGGSGGEWVTIGRIGSSGTTIKPIIACYGDPSRLISPFYKNYVIKFKTEPDCALCEGTTCIASAASVTVERDGEIVETADMFPGSTHVFGWDSDYQYIPLITFVAGEAESSLCNSSEEVGMMTGPQAVSDFTIYITQRNTIVKSEVETLETEPITQVPTEVATTAETQVTVAAETPAQSATTPETPGFTVICALSAIFAAVCMISGRVR